MKHHNNEEEEKNYDYLYYLVALVSGLFIGVVLDKGFIYVPILGLFGLMFAGFFVKVFVRGRNREA